ncbi:ABC transporter permease [Devosia rhizoryzae]|uniref:Iron ABC transporter permease n=1 Tax=Devosia rhizoryzae TaxID=2774137 RepID=A0ABX7C4V7_9HYPH|nr:iron ABC transporter permease [Devosia rhizoryzae]QQR39277.1 iron ABC transporter permease [Devosia rhizoryzae]
MTVTTDPQSIRAIPTPRARREGPSFILCAAVVTGLLSLMPLAFVLYVALTSGWQAIAHLVLRPKVGALLLNTSALLAIVLPVSALLALAFAWLIERTDIPFARFWSWIMVAPLAVPAFVHSYAWSAFAPRFHGLAAAALVSILAYLPFIYLPIAAQLRRLDPALEETAQSMGKSPPNVFLRVVLPQLRLAIMGGALLIGLHLLAEYGLFVLTRFDTFATVIVDQFQSVGNGPSTNLLGGVLVLLCLILFGLETRLRGQERYARVGAGAARSRRRSTLGRWTWPALTLCGLFALLSLAVPAWTLLGWLASGGADIWRFDFILPALGQTALLTLSGAALTTIAALPIAWLTVRAPSRLQKLLEASHSYVGALPGIIIALALVTVTVNISLPLYQTVATLLLAYVLMFLPRALVGLRTSIAQAPVELERAATSLGRPPLSAIWHTTIRLAAPGALASAALVGLGITTELTATLMLAPNGTRTLAMRFWAYTSELDLAMAAPYALLMVLLSVPLVVLLHGGADHMSQA